MKKSLVIAFLIGISSAASSQRLLTEDFNYPTGQLTAGGSGANTSGGAWISSSGNGNYIPVVAGSLTYPNYLTGPSGTNNNKVSLVAAVSSAEDAYTQFATQTTGTVYASFLLVVKDQTNLADNASGTPDFFAGFLSSTSASTYNVGRVYIRKGVAINTFNLGIAANTPSSTPIVYSPVDYTIGTTHLVTISYTIVTGTLNDNSKLFVDAPYSVTEPTPDASSDFIAGTEPANISRFYLRQGTIAASGPTTPNADIDAIKISTNYADAAVPLSLISFKGSLVDKNLQLNWTTANEQNVKSYTIERSSDGRSFNAIGIVIAKNTAAAEYNFIDNAPLSNAGYYRLRMTDLDGSVKFSNVILINNRKSITTQIFPNPAGNNISVSHDKAGANASLKIMDASGRQLKTIPVISGATQTGILVNDLKPGQYLLSFVNNGESVFTKFIKN